ncbi:PipA/GogA/GtgA family type III secretion system effector [Pseudomonas sp. MDT1-17]
MYTIHPLKTFHGVTKDPDTGPLKNCDQTLATRHSDMFEQWKNPSRLRKQYDLQALDDGPVFELSRLQEHLLVDVSGADESKEIVCAKQILIETLILCYDKSSTFRRLYNHAFEASILNEGGRFTLELQPHTGDFQSLFPLLADTKAPQKELHRIDTPHSLSTGERACSPRRHWTEQLIASITGLPQREENHPRGPIQEYANIILTQTGRSSELAQEGAIETSSTLSPAPLGTRPLTLLTSRLIKSNLALKSGGQPKEGNILKSVEAALAKASQARLDLIAKRPRLFHPELQRKTLEDRQNAQRLPGLLLQLVKGIADDESPLGILGQMAQQNFRQRIFSYRIDKYRDPFDLVRHRDGDCSSLAHLFALLGEAAGIQGITTKVLDTEMAFTLSENPEIPNLKGGQTVAFARHTILAVRDAEADTMVYFDPVFGCEVAPHYYGLALSSYLMKGRPQSSEKCDTRSLAEVVPTSVEGTTRVTG